MTPPVYAIATHAACPLGLNTAAMWRSVIAGKSGILRYEDAAYGPFPFWASKLGPDQWQVIQSATRATRILSPFEQLALYSAWQAMHSCEVALNPDKTVFILATTKGNIEWLGIESDERNALSTSAVLIAEAIGIAAPPVVVSHACVSGVVALLYGFRLLQSGRYKHAIVTGADRFTRFVLSGFQSFQAVADERCRPFDAARKGINLGEAASTIILSTDISNEPLARLCGGATSNDANHISGPSRTGEELAMAIDRALAEDCVKNTQIGAISAHGTATIYNDEMEAKAFARAGLLAAEVHSLKGYTGHTLGAAGVLESAMLLQSLREQTLIPSAGFETIGVSEPLKVTTEARPATSDYALKTASGFGGCNAAMVWGRV